MLVLACGPGVAQRAPARAEWAGHVGIEPRVFLDSPAFPAQPDRGISFSAVASPEFRLEWNDGDDRVTVSPFVRLDADDDDRSHADLREANWLHFAGPWTLRIGVGEVFWGVTESRHLVDIVNQIDQVEDVDEEDKLGQPMINVSRYTDHGTYSAFVLPYFRERTFPADDARLRGPLPIAGDSAVYESSAGQSRTDIAFRWERVLGRFDIGVSGFRGTGRRPRLVPAGDAEGRLALVPHYDVIGQAGLDLQYTHEAWLWKLEAIRRTGQGRTFSAVVAGFEHTLFGIGGGSADLGVLAEYLHDGRDATAPAAALDDDLFVGLRLALNDVSGTMLLLGALSDRETRGVTTIVEGRRRLWQRWRLELELRDFDNASDPALAGIRQDSFLTIRLARFF